MDLSTWIMLLIAAAALAAVYLRSPDSAAQGLTSGMALFLEILPRMVAAFVLAGLVQAVVPREIITGLMGRESGVKGLLIGMALGTFTPGGPMMHFPIVASLYKSGVAIGPLVSYLTAWSLLGLQRLIMWEFPFLGPSVVLVRVASSLLFPLVAGWISNYLWLKLSLDHP
jgi:uncharacterized membrane protein YraQ (UPF0718 family)